MIHEDKRKKAKGEMDSPTHECDACGVTVSIWDLHSIGVISRVCDECYMNVEKEHEKCSQCESKDDVKERYSYGVYAGRLCKKCCLSFQDHCGIDQPQGNPQELDEPNEEELPF